MMRVCDQEAIGRGLESGDTGVEDVRVRSEMQGVDEQVEPWSAVAI